MIKQFSRNAGVLAIGAVCLTAVAQEGTLLPSADSAGAVPPTVPGASAGSVEGGIEFTTPPEPGVPYHEYFHYSSYAKRTYVPGYTPHVTSLYENPKTYPSQLGPLVNPYHVNTGLPGWHFGSPYGYRGSNDKGSQSNKYFRGELGITDNLRGGYPQGMRVIEPAIVPIAASAEKGGIFISGGGVGQLEVGAENELITEYESTLVKPAPVPAPVYVPESLEK